MPCAPGHAPCSVPALKAVPGGTADWPRQLLRAQSTSPAHSHRSRRSDRRGRGGSHGGSGGRHATTASATHPATATANAAARDGAVGLGRGDRLSWHGRRSRHGRPNGLRGSRQASRRGGRPWLGARRHGRQRGTLALALRAAVTCRLSTRRTLTARLAPATKPSPRHKRRRATRTPHTVTAPSQVVGLRSCAVIVPSHRPRYETNACMVRTTTAHNERVNARGGAVPDVSVTYRVGTTLPALEQRIRVPEPCQPRTDAAWPF